MNRSRVFLLLLSALSIDHSAFGTEMNRCGSSIPYPLTVNYSINSYSCDSTPCVAVLNCPSVVAFTFKAPRYLERIKPKIHASCMGVELDYPLGQNDACVGINNTQCPIVKNELVSYYYKLTIPPIFPEVTVTLAFSLLDQDQNDEPIVCLEFDAIIRKQTTCPS